ncbi:hypothetical protein CW304_19245 [Bacillus sp. UFRGS-B20]|nr:hypothetical protein CW304_19245 [Bacillus sp. UFRGS-B20]
MKTLQQYDFVIGFTKVANLQLGGNRLCLSSAPQSGISVVLDQGQPLLLMQFNNEWFSQSD